MASEYGEWNIPVRAPFGQVVPGQPYNWMRALATSEDDARQQVEKRCAEQHAYFHRQRTGALKPGEVDPEEFQGPVAS